MSRVLLTAFGGVVCGAAFWMVLGALAALIFSKMPGGAREGGGAMAGFFIVGPACGVVGLLLGSWLVWKQLANPDRAGIISIALVAVVAALVIGTMIAMQPAIVVPNDFPGQKAELLVEMSFPAAAIDNLRNTDRIEFEMRSADGTEVAPWKREQIRHEGNRAIVPGAFSIRTTPRSKLLAVMKNGGQMMCSTLTVDDGLSATTEWSQWQPMEEGLLARWRLLVTPDGAAH